MTDFSTPLKDLEDAKAYFQAMGCSHFHMSREYPEMYDEYRSMSIDKSMEREWTRESLAALYDQIIDLNSDKTDLWWMHSRMADLTQILQTTEAIEILHSTTLHIIDRLQPQSSLLVAETIIGRQQIGRRGGMIFLAYNLGLNNTARDFAFIALKLIDRARQEGYDTARCNEAHIKCNRIIEQLKISAT